MSLSINIGRPFLNDKTLDEQARSVLRLYGTNAHVYLPGANGVAVSGLPTNNYTLSDGSTGYSAVDGTAGLVLDGAGSVGANVVVNGDFATDTVWGKGPQTTIAGGKATIASTGAASSLSQNSILTAASTYRITFDAVVRSGTAKLEANGGGTYLLIDSTKSYSCLFTGSTNVVFNRLSACDIDIDNVVAREVTGIHATQATTANKPALRRGLYNLLTYSQDFTQAVWAVQATCTKGASGLFNLPAVNDAFLQTHTATYGAGTALTAAYELSGSGTVTVEIYRNDAGTPEGYQQSITLSTTPTIFVAPFTFTASHTSYRARVIRLAGDTATVVTISKAGLFQGTLTAAQILAEGGIPLTTSAAASNSGAGRYSWQFDGVNDQLVCASAPFQITDDFAIVVAVNANTIAGFPGVLSVDDGGSTNAVALYLNSGVPTAYVMAGGTLQAATAGPAITAGSAYVLSIVKTGSSLKIRKNGVDGTTVSTVGVGSAAFTAMRIGYQPVGLAYWSGAIGEPMFIKGTVSASDLSTLERQVASTFPAAPTF